MGAAPVAQPTRNLTVARRGGSISTFPPDTQYTHCPMPNKLRSCLSSGVLFLAATTIASCAVMAPQAAAAPSGKSYVYKTVGDRALKIYVTEPKEA